ncbi:MAG: CvpA family protein [Dehalococcoidales bacterium]|jgi:membrane protein required for colicin V production|nr:CvpA family protein [Dehalococcoidales bacterium]MDX9986954.1 CvpA family protein [Dehalococcoidales bacterium]NLE90758.1 CvpA family protein [Dehalococcoidales bacterium]
MNWLDIILLVFLGLSAFHGLTRGFIKSAFAIVGAIAGVILASRFYDNVSAWFGFSGNNVFNVFSFVLILIAAMIITTLLANLVKTVISAILLGWADRIGGAILGLTIGATLLGALLSLWVKLFESSILTDSFIACFLVSKFPLLVALLPAEFDSVRDFFTAFLF